MGSGKVGQNRKSIALIMSVASQLIIIRVKNNPTVGLSK